MRDSAQIWAGDKGSVCLTRSLALAALLCSAATPGMELTLDEGAMELLLKQPEGSLEMKGHAEAGLQRAPWHGPHGLHGRALGLMQRLLHPQWPVASQHEWVLCARPAGKGCSSFALCDRMYTQQHADSELRLALVLVGT
jgi:hypothetical protein